MKSDDIRRQIRENENIIGQYQAEIRELNAKIDELELLRNKLSNLQHRFADRQALRRRGVAKFLGNKAGCSVVRKYYDGMSELLTGREYGRAYDGLVEAKANAMKIIRELLDEIEKYEQRIGNLKRSNTSLHSQWASAIEEEQEG